MSSQGKVLVTAHFWHNGKQFQKGKEISLEELDGFMTEKQALALHKNGCLKFSDEIESEISSLKQEPEKAEEIVSEENPPEEGESEEQSGEESSEAPSESKSEGKKKKGKK